jgi:hypothetical protein
MGGTADKGGAGRGSARGLSGPDAGSAVAEVEAAEGSDERVEDEQADEDANELEFGVGPA